MNIGEAFGTLVVARLNELGYDGMECCADCCAPCGSVRDLLDAGILDAVIAQAPPHLAVMYQPLDEKWLRSRWGCTSRPRCEQSCDEAAELNKKDPSRHGGDAPHEGG